MKTTSLTLGDPHAPRGAPLQLPAFRDVANIQRLLSGSQ